MRLRTKEEAIDIISQCALEYRRNLSNNCILFVAATGNSYTCFEALFMPQNYKHLTGVRSKLNGSDFFSLAVRNRISLNDITLTNDGVTDLKLDILPQLMNIHLTARMIGDYDQSRSLLITDKIAGTVTAAMGFTRTNDMYLPNTALKKDVREITIHATRRRVAAIFIKPRGTELYKQLTYIAKGVMLDDDHLLPHLQDKVDIYNLTADFPIPRMSVEDSTQ